MQAEEGSRGVCLDKRGLGGTPAAESGGGSRLLKACSTKFLLLRVEMVSFSFNLTCKKLGT